MGHEILMIGDVFMANPFKQIGFKAFHEENERRKKIIEAKRGKLFRFFLKDGEQDVPIRFLTSEPVLFYEHTIKSGENFVNVTCIGEDCPYCEDKSPTFKGAFLIVDGREFEIDERDQNGNKTGKKKTVKDRLKLLVRGQTDLAKLDRLSSKWGLDDRIYYVSRIGSGQATIYEYDRGEKEKLTPKQLSELLLQLPEKYRDMDLYDIVEAQIFEMDIEDDEDISEEVKQSVKESVSSGIRKLLPKKSSEKDTPKKVTKKLSKVKK